MAERLERLFGMLAGALALAALCVGCASDLVLVDGRFVQREHGFAFAEPAQPPWRRIEVEGTLVAYTRPGGALMSVQSECGRRPPSPQIQARSLLIGLSSKRVRQSAPVAVGPWQGWSQSVDVGEEGGPLRRMKSVTLVAEDCTVDFVLVAGDDFESLEPGFDAWWQSFEHGVALPGGAGA